MATVNGYTAEYMDSLMDENIVDGSISGDNLILEKRDGSTVNAGNVRGPAGADAAPGDISPTAGTTPIRTTGGRTKVGTPTATDDATTKAYVDAADAALDTRVDTLEATDITLDSRIDALEAIADRVRRVGAHHVTADGTLSASEQNICTVTIPNPINGRRYRVTASATFVASASCEGRMRVKHGISAVTGGTQIDEACLDHSGTRANSRSLVVEFTFGGTTGQANYNVVMTCISITASTTYRHSANGTRPAVLIVDEIS
jgi:hypothetical protein